MPGSTVLPQIGYADIGEATARLCEDFGFRLRLRIGDHRAQLHVDDAHSGAIILVQQTSPVIPRASTMIRVSDVSAHCERARRSEGVRIVSEPTDFPYGERQCAAVDYAGHHWCFSQTIADVDPSEWGGTPGHL